MDKYNKKKCYIFFFVMSNKEFSMHWFGHYFVNLVYI